jgi:hypothetical protein
MGIVSGISDTQVSDPGSVIQTSYFKRNQITRILSPLQLATDMDPVTKTTDNVWQGHQPLS